MIKQEQLLSLKRGDKLYLVTSLNLVEYDVMAISKRQEGEGIIAELFENKLRRCVEVVITEGDLPNYFLSVFEATHSQNNNIREWIKPLKEEGNLSQYLYNRCKNYLPDMERKIIGELLRGDI